MFDFSVLALDGPEGLGDVVSPEKVEDEKPRQHEDHEDAGEVQDLALEIIEVFHGSERSHEGVVNTADAEQYDAAHDPNYEPDAASNKLYILVQVTVVLHSKTIYLVGSTENKP